MLGSKIGKNRQAIQLDHYIYIKPTTLAQDLEIKQLDNYSVLFFTMIVNTNACRFVTIRFHCSQI